MGLFFNEEVRITLHKPMKNTIILKKNTDFAYVLKKGTWYSGDLVTMYIVRSQENGNKLGIAISKKFSKSSVKRNRAKRIIKEIYRLSEDTLYTGNIIVILLKNDVLYPKITYENMKHDLFRCFQKAGLIKNDAESL